MELGIIIVLALAGVYTAMLVAGAVMETKVEGKPQNTAIQDGRTAA